MTVVGLDDTDSRELGMCTTYVADSIANRLDRGGAVERLLLCRLNPAVPHKTRGNAALAIHVDCDPEWAFDVAREELERLSETDDERTNPGLVVAEGSPEAIPSAVAEFARMAVRDHHEIADAETLADDCGYRRWRAGNGRGTIGALAGVGAWAAFDEWTYEVISYRHPDRWGTPRRVDRESVFAAAEWGYPDAWDTVDRGEGETVCVPHTPGPILHGIRGDDSDVVREVARRIESESVDQRRLFVTNQGTDAHLRDGTDDSLADVRDGRAYILEGVVASEPETRRGGHVFFELADGRDDDPTDESADDPTDEPAEKTNRIECAAFEPTKRFRDRVRALRVGDRLTVCGELSRGTCKLEKFAVRDLVETTRVVPTCPACGRTMESAGREQGYRCRSCETSRPGKVVETLDRDLEKGWYEVPPCARRHVAKPLIRGGFDGPVHPER